LFSRSDTFEGEEGIAFLASYAFFSSSAVFACHLGQPVP